MTFALSKIFWFLVRPGNLLLLFMAAGTGLNLAGRRRLGGGLLAVVTVLAFAVALLPVAEWLTRPLENRFPPPAGLPETVAGIVVLGGAVEPVLTELRRQPSLNRAAERMTELVRLARRYPQARLLFTGGNGALFPGRLHETDVAKLLFDGLGVDPDRVTYEGESRNTYENVVLSRALMQPKDGEIWLLVTSALHMPRAVGIFRRQGWPVVPWPVDYRSGPSGGAFEIDFASNLIWLEDTLKEWIGLAVYRMLDRTDAWFPAPEQG